MRLRSANLAGWVSTEQDGNVALSLEERAALDTPLLAYPQAASVIHVSPREQDLAPQTARELAQQAVTRKYGAALDSLTAGLESLVLYTDTEQRVYTLNVSDSGASYRVRLDAATGQTLTFTAYAGGTEDFRLPEGDLSAYPGAGEFVESGASTCSRRVEKPPLPGAAEADFLPPCCRNPAMPHLAPGTFPKRMPLPWPKPRWRIPSA